jgi:glucose/arabinose dehydrogenase
VLAGSLFVAAVILGGACGDDEPAPEPTVPPTNTAVATQDQQQGQTTTIVPGVTKGTETAVPTPSETPTPPAPPPVALSDAFPGLPGLTRPVELLTTPISGAQWWLVAEQGGTIIGWEAGQAAGATVALELAVSRDGNEEGLLGMAFDPHLLSDRPYLYVYYSVASGDRRTRLSRFDVDLARAPEIDAGSELVILEVPQPFSNHNGGKIAFGPDGYLYIGLGDGGSGGDPRGNGQNAATLLGSILRIDVTNSSADQPYTVPANNPFAGSADARGEIWAYGLRNPWRFSFDGDGRLWAGDVGQGEYEEIDLIEGGGNYGWNEMEGFECYQRGCDPSRYEAPVATYDHGFGCSVTGGVVHEGPGALNGWYVFGDYCSGIIWAFYGDGPYPGESPEVLLETGVQISSFADDPAGEGIYVLSFDGRIYYLRPV